MRIDINNLDLDDLEELPIKEKVVPKKKPKKDEGENPVKKDTYEKHHKKRENIDNVLF